MDSIRDYDDKVKSAIGCLLRYAHGSPNSKKVISAFEYTASAQTNKAALLRFSRDALDECALFLGIPLLHPGTKEKMYSNREKLVHRIILRIQTFYPSFCMECREEYFNELNTSSLMLCFICSHGSHDCEDVQAKFDVASTTPQPAGVVWLCSGCYEENDPLKSASTSTTPKTPSSVSQSQPHTPIETKNDGLEGDLLIGKLNDVKAQQEQLIEPIEKTSPTPVETTDCPNLLVGQCPHGVTGKTPSGGHDKCKLVHRKVCRKFQKYGTKAVHGCSDGTSCANVHVQHCKSSVQHHNCYNDKCTLSHLAGTKRFKDKPPPAIRQSRPNGPPAPGQDSYRRNQRRESSGRQRLDSGQRYSEALSSRQDRGANNDRDSRLPADNKHFLEIRSLLGSMQDSFQKQIETLKMDIGLQKTMIEELKTSPTVPSSHLLHLPRHPPPPPPSSALHPPSTDPPCPWPSM